MSFISLWNMSTSSREQSWNRTLTATGVLRHFAVWTLPNAPVPMTSRRSRSRAESRKGSSSPSPRARTPSNFSDALLGCSRSAAGEAGGDATARLEPAARKSIGAAWGSGKEDKLLLEPYVNLMGFRSVPGGVPSCLLGVSTSESAGSRPSMSPSAPRGVCSGTLGSVGGLGVRMLLHGAAAAARARNPRPQKSLYFSSAYARLAAPRPAAKKRSLVA